MIRAWMSPRLTFGNAGRWFVATVLVAVLLLPAAIVKEAVTSSPRVMTAAAVIKVPAGLPSHFGVGLGNVSQGSTGLSGWMPNSGSPWDYANNYLSGGVNTGTGWSTWGGGNGNYALQFAGAAHQHGYIPALSYYNLFQSNGTCNSCSEPNKDLSNLNNPATMASFYRDFTLALQRLGTGTYGGIAGFGHTAVLHVEPDLSGYAEQAVLDPTHHCFGFCTVQGNNPGDLRASVATSGVAAVAAYPNTYQGFNWALLHLRDLYAPNVLLAIHVSGWSTGPDIDGDTTATLNASTLGQEAGSFAAQSGTAGTPAGVSTYDVIFNDVANTDSAAGGGHWWDQLNVTFPNFTRWESYISAITQAAGRSVIVWQVPMGNEYFDTVNNSTGHTEDNRAQYFFSHIAEMVNNGLIGMIFGDGVKGTEYWDAMNDGITNPLSFCTTNGLSIGQICNTHTSTVTDDDGGFIRMKGQQYYASPYPLSGSPPPPTTTSTTTSTTTTVPPPGSISFVQANAHTGSGTSLSDSFSSSVRTGDFLVAAVRTQGNPSVSDNLNGAWTRAPVSNPYTSIWYHANAKGGATTVTLTAGTSGQLRADMAEYSGVATTSPYDSGACLGGSGATVTTGNTASIPAGELVFAGVGTSSNPNTVSAGSSMGVAASMRSQVTNSNGTIGVEDVTKGASGVQNAGMTLSGALTAGWNACVATFKA